MALGTATIIAPTMIPMMIATAMRLFLDTMAPVSPEPSEKCR